MGCLSGKVTRASDGLQGKARRVGAELMAVVADVTERLRCAVLRMGNGLQGAVLNVTEGLQGRAFIVCSMADLKYLNVSPEEVVWITPEQGVVYHVESNTTWVVVYEL